MECKSNNHTQLLTAKGGITHEENHRPRYRSPWHHRISVSGIRSRDSLELKQTTHHEQRSRIKSLDGFQSCCPDLKRGGDGYLSQCALVRAALDRSRGSPAFLPYRDAIPGWF